jgi:endoglucanase
MLLLGGAMSGCSSSSPSDPSRASTATAAARQFLHDYVGPDGRTVRRDQGGDTVSEAQGYAMLLAVAVRDRARFTSVWNWTRDNLQRPSALFAYRWANGRVASTEPASDADLQIGWALSMAGSIWHESQWTAAASKIAKAIATGEIGYDDNGAPTLAAGPWAVRHNAPTVVEPGYWTSPATANLAKGTGDNRLRDLANADLGHLRGLTRDGATLPPDWAHVGGGSGPVPVPAPDGSAPAQAGLDGLRAVIWTSCSGAAGRGLAARWWPLLQSTGHAAPLALTLDGKPRSHDEAPLTAVAAAAAAQAAGHDAEAMQLLDRAAAINHSHPSYYGTAWVALGRVLLTTDRLATC